MKNIILELLMTAWFLPPSTSVIIPKFFNLLEGKRDEKNHKINIFTAKAVVNLGLLPLMAMTVKLCQINLEIVRQDTCSLRRDFV